MEVKICAYVTGCLNPAAKGQKYCSREHAPYGNYDVCDRYKAERESSLAKRRRLSRKKRNKSK